jgi:uncharacterized protein (TIGR02246 family)
MLPYTTTKEGPVRLRLFVLLIASSVAFSCAPPEPAHDPAADRAAIEAANDAWLSAFNSGDAAAVASIYAEDGKLYPPGSPPVVGRAAIQDLWQSFVDMGVTGELSTEEIKISGDLAYRIGSYTVLGPDGSQMDQGHFVELWQRQNGDWAFTHDIWNSDLAPPAEAEATGEGDS